jgi:gliding motility-associated-like protein
MVTRDGCLAMDSILTTPPSGTIYFPNAFTPDGDGLNETFGGIGRLIEVYELYIFDRWGSLIFESHDPIDRWDGSVRGSAGPVKTEVYNYRYRVRLLDENMTEGFGHVTLLK